MTQQNKLIKRLRPLRGDLSNDEVYTETPIIRETA